MSAGASCRWRSCARSAPSSAGRDVATYIQSGNVVFAADGKPAAIEAALEEAIAKRFGLDVAGDRPHRRRNGRAIRPANPFRKARRTRPTG